MIHIVTVYDSLNYGSYFQALALKNYLEKYDSTDYLDIHHQNLIKDTIISMARCIKHGRLNEAMALWKKLCVFKKSQSNFPTTDINDANKNDIYFFGSDEIWNLDREKMKKNKEFFGKNIYSNNKIAYAPSVNTTSVDKFLNQSFYKDSLSKFIGVSVRDSHSKLVIEEVLNKDIPLVVDPTLLMPEEFYLHKMAKNNYLKSDYILIYSYGAMFKETHLKERIMSFAKKNKLMLISIGQYFDFCDYNIIATPEEFLKYISDSKFVITDTFHGTIFSIIFKKEFVSVDIKNMKVNNLLNDYGLNERILTSSDDLESMYNKSVDYFKSENLLKDRIDFSKGFIEEMINKVVKR